MSRKRSIFLRYPTKKDFFEKSHWKDEKKEVCEETVKIV